MAQLQKAWKQPRGFYCRSRTLDEVVAKVNEIRAINLEYAEDRIKFQTAQWVRAGYRNVSPNPQRVIPPVNVSEIEVNFKLRPFHVKQACVDNVISV
ncbi:hypothetical protein KIN20_017090 [Parelaphostrongylus tenuis]|uniref:Uncharacterized protein n=1 Tax=Parelaphostrongylus tenuis TaxID=148309 RepID=A0AAD5QR80_PARTN|nr:hypothetical protein KIN20_017090 [Parelaphostrongylus tenuis]